MAKKRVKSADNHGEDKKRADKKSAKKVPSALGDLLAQLDRMKQDPTASEVRLRSDLARDAAEEVFAKFIRRMRRKDKAIRRLQERSDRWRTRLNDLLQELATGAVILPPVPGSTPANHDQLTVTFRKLKSNDVTHLAQAIRDAVGAGDLPAYQRFLVDEIVIKGSRIVAEHLVRLASHPADQPAEDEFLRQLRHHVAGNV